MDFILELFKGVIIGISNVIPGVSGGTMAVSMHIYDKVIFAVTNLFKDFKNSIKVLLPYGIGAVCGIVFLSFVIEFLFNHYPIQTNFVFIGLILGGIPQIYQRTEKKLFKPSNFALFILFALLIIGLKLIEDFSGKEVVLTISFTQILLLFFVGVIASASMVIPGISGSMILMLLGYYRPIIESINTTVRALMEFDFSGILTGAAILGPFGIGIIIGIFGIAKIIEMLLKHYEVQTYSAITGLVIASPVALLMGLDYSSIGALGIGVSLILLLIGFLIPYKVFSRL